MLELSPAGIEQESTFSELPIHVIFGMKPLLKGDRHDEARLFRVHVRETFGHYNVL